MRGRRVFSLTGVCLAGLVGSLLVGLRSPAGAALFDHSAYDEVLKRYVDDEGLVNYTAIRENSLSALESYFERLGSADLAGWPYKERLAFWIDAYNAFVLYQVAQKPKLKKISDDFELFNKPFKVAGEMVSLNDIKHRILRGTKNRDNQKGPIPGLTLETRDPRVHFALVNGTVDDPKLHPFAYTAENVEETFYGNSRRFANSQKFVDIADGRLYLSTLLKWYANDFEEAGGVAAFLREQITPEKRADAQQVEDLLAVYLNKAQYHYDWTVNDQTSRSPQKVPTYSVPEKIKL